jgi:hypothetical protein
LYLRIFPSRIIRNTAKGTIAFLLLACLANLIAAVLQCQPLAYWWDKSIVGGTCFDVQSYYRMQSVPNLITDAIVLALPLQPIWNLKMARIKKVGLAVAFLTASMSVFP